MIPRLVLFDIDDTLITRATKAKIGLIRWRSAIHDVFGINIDIRKHFVFDGLVDMQVGWELVKDFGISRPDYNHKFPQIADALYNRAVESEINPETYMAISESAEFVHQISQIPGIYIGLLTGNLEKIGWWKLKVAGYDGVFKFGLFSDNAETREDIARRTIDKANQFFQINFNPDQIIVIGDTIHDIDCGKSIGAKCIGVNYGPIELQQKLRDQKADLVVETLADPKVMNFILK
jgi:phosphoglycolate phosphatase